MRRIEIKKIKSLSHPISAGYHSTQPLKQIHEVGLGLQQTNETMWIMTARKRTRRSAIATIAVGIVGTVASATAAEQQGEKQKETDSNAKKYTLRAPDDVTIQKILKPDGPVLKGQSLIQLRSISAERFEQRIALIKNMILIVEKSLSDERIQIQRKALQDAIDTATDASNAAYDHHHMLEIQSAVSGGSNALTEAISNAEISLDEKSDIAAQAKLKLTNFDFQTSDRKDQIQTMKSYLEKEEKFIMDMKDMLEIKAPAQGSFKMVLLENSFAKKGDTIAILEL